MAFSHKKKALSVVVKIEDVRLDASLTPQFKEYCTEIISEGAEEIILDLSMVTFVDSSGLGAIVGLLKRLNGTGGVKLVGITAPVEGLLRMTRMDRIFRCFDTIESAMA